MTVNRVQLKVQNLKRKTAARSWTVGELIRHGARRFHAARLAFGHGTTNARDEAAYLALDALALPLEADAANLGRPVSARDALRVTELFERRIRERKPAAYLTGEAWLGPLRFRVDERVIVPRSHIAALLNERLLPWMSGRAPIRSALDLCTGSGCLAIMLARVFPKAVVDATDLSSAALAVAQINVAEYRLRQRIRLIRSDLFSSLRHKQYDLIVSNPPYVTSAAMRRLPREYHHEPRIALDGGADGLTMIRTILRQSPLHLRPGGTLVVEVGKARRRVERAFPRIDFMWPDTAGGDAVFILRREQLAAR